MTVFVAVVQWLHVIAGILWAGGSAALDLLVMPIIVVLPPRQQRLLGQRLVARATPFFAITGAATLLLGIVRGTVLGPIQSVAALGSGYGLTWLAALVLTGGLAFWGARIVGPAAEQLYADASHWAPDGANDAPALAALRQNLGIRTRVQLVGFAGVLVCMILMAEVFS